MDWSKLTHQIKEEVFFTRELLSNLIAEENSLKSANDTFWKDLMYKRFMLTETLKPFRLQRELATKHFHNLTCFLDEEQVSELSWLLDQLLPLLEKINTQNKKNQKLLEKTSPLVANGYPLTYSVEKTAKRKNRVTTLVKEGSN